MYTHTRIEKRIKKLEKLKFRNSIKAYQSHSEQ